MKNKFFIAAVALLALCAPAIAQFKSGYYGVSTPASAFNGGTNNVGGSATLSPTTNNVFDVTQFGDVAFQPVFKLSGSGTSGVLFTFDYSCDNTNWVTSVGSLNVTANGATVVTGITNVTVNSVGYWRCSSIVNSNATAVTNLTILLVQKTRRFGN